MVRNWRSLLLVCLSALIVIVVVDQLAASFVPPVNRREAEDGIRDLERSNPDVLVLGSSHARTLHVLGEELSTRTQGRRKLVAVPVENGKLVVYDWTLQHRLARLIEERKPDGALVRDRLSEFILITEWWDSCPPDEKQRYAYWNLPSRAWGAGDFLQDVATNGLNGYNRNYLQNRMRRWFAGSALLYDRINQKLVENSMDVLRGRPLELTPEAEQQKILSWQRMLERGVTCIGHPAQIEALENIISYVKGRGLEITILLFPRKPNTMSDAAKDTTLRRFAGLVGGIAARNGVRLVDLTSTTPLLDDDFMEDFDHVNAAGNVKFAKWALQGPLQFLLDDPPLVQSSANDRRVSP